MKYYKSHIDVVKHEKELLATPHEEAIIVVHEQTEVFYGKEGTCDIKWCEENGIPYIQQDLPGGGCIVGAKGSIVLTVKQKSVGQNCLSNVFSKDIRDYFISKGLNSSRCDNNDVLIDGFKVASGCDNQINGFNYFGYQIAINQDMETIKHACSKPMVKIPKALSEYDITTEEMVWFCEQWCKSHNIE